MSKIRISKALWNITFYFSGISPWTNFDGNKSFVPWLLKWLTTVPGGSWRFLCGLRTMTAKLNLCLCKLIDTLWRLLIFCYWMPNRIPRIWYDRISIFTISAESSELIFAHFTKTRLEKNANQHKGRYFHLVFFNLLG